MSKRQALALIAVLLACIAGAVSLVLDPPEQQPEDTSYLPASPTLKEPKHPDTH